MRTAWPDHEGAGSALVSMPSPWPARRRGVGDCHECGEDRDGERHERPGRSYRLALREPVEVCRPLGGVEVHERWPRSRRILAQVSIPPDGNAPDIAALIARLRVGHLIDDAIDQLASLGEPCIEPLLTTVQSRAEPGRARELAAIALGHIAPGGVACLLTLLDGDDDELADLAAWGLRWPPRCALAEPVLGAMLGDPDAHRRLRGLRGLQHIGVDATALDPRILECARDDAPHIRVAAMAVIERVGLDAPGVRDVLEGALADPDSSVREAARRALGQLGE